MRRIETGEPSPMPGADTGGGETVAGRREPRPVSPAALVAVGAVRAYQWTIRPIIGANCRFWPSCSDYAIDALRSHGALRGGALAAKRVLRCNPWHEGGWDPVPDMGKPTGQRAGH